MQRLLGMAIELIRMGLEIGFEQAEKATFCMRLTDS